MPYVYVSIGSNIEQQRHISACLDALKEHFGELALSPVYESEAVGFEGENFYNLVAGFSTGLGVAELARLLRLIEAENGRKRNGPKFSARTLDIDILTYDNLTGTVEGVLLPRDEILHNAFVLLPLAELAPEDRHPSLKVTYQALWEDYDKKSQKLWKIPFQWQGRSL